jgi:hypothetical protein
MTKKQKLSIEYVPEFTVTGIFTSQKHYRFCWLLNKQLNLDFKRLPDFFYSPSKQTKALPFPVFFDEIPQLLLQYYLIVNKTPAGLLFDKPQNLDLLLLLKNSGDQVDPAELVNSIKQIPMVQAAFLLDGKLGKQGPNILYDLEMYLCSLPKISQGLF